MNTPADTLRLLQLDAEQGHLERLCRQLDIDLLVLFGSVRFDSAAAHDVDVAFQFRHGVAGDELGVVNALQSRYGDGLDVMALDRAGVVARFEALAKGEPLVELDEGSFATRQMAAMGEFYDNQHLRDLALEVLRG